MKQRIPEKLSILISFIGAGAFGVGVIGSLIQGGFIAICFAIALSSGMLVFCLDALNPFKKLATIVAAKPVPIKPDENSGLQPH